MYGVPIVPVPGAGPVDCSRISGLQDMASKSSFSSPSCGLDFRVLPQRNSITRLVLLVRLDPVPSAIGLF
ncbi:hypothetical protein N7468_006720 [Penicillium chermesinum]|uniref:Uncharacterized protein n=1 Tax=Penicillium chermesinum TaxID=63820 RepID=A0A9W9NSQ9_9EURO|nr:uncharacterized protein N7468_006720 [Penicillium chermesinum]KAJ5225495.1 hypothetical protein N7468_006720 [Penicillium chermesinum]